MGQMLTLVDLLESAAQPEAGRGIVYIDPSGEETDQSYPSLRHEAQIILGGLRRIGVRPGDPLMLVINRPNVFLPTFWACQLGGIIPVPLAGPAGLEDVASARRLEAVWRHMEKPRVMCDPEMKLAAQYLLGRGSDTGEDRIFTLEDLDRREPDRDYHAVEPEDLALVQFSSGSTSTPRGICLSHSNILANIRQIARRIRLTRDDTELGWMPHFHDMGLIATHLTPILIGMCQVRMQPWHFLRRPDQWLDKATQHRVSILTSTNTAMKLILRRIKEVDRERWDLSSLRLFMVGAEPVSAPILRRFIERLAPIGLSADKVHICYGLAEASVGVASDPPDAPFRVHQVERDPLIQERRVVLSDQAGDGVYELMEVGPPLDGVQIRITDEAGRSLPELQAGEIEVQGPNVTRGYLRDPKATREARDGEWWRTGDLGFLYQGKLTICGRIKDLLIVGGQNILAEDVEEVANQLPGIRAAVACAVPAPDRAGEQILLFLSPDGEEWRDGIEMLQAARHRVQRVFGIQVDQVIPIRYRDIPRTSAGKIPHFRLARRFLKGKYDEAVQEYHALAEAMAVPGPESSTEPPRGVAAPDAPEKAPPSAPDTSAPVLPGSRSWLHQLVRETWAAVLEIDPARIGPSTTWAELGGTSLGAQEVLARLEDALNRSLGQDLLITCQTVVQMADFLFAPRPDGLAWPDGTRRGAGILTGDGPRALVDGQDIAVIAMACRIKGARTPEALWTALAQGTDLVGPIPRSRWPGEAMKEVGCRWGSFLEDPHAFDWAFFGMPRDEAMVSDPQQRLMLMMAFECLERGGYGMARREGLRVGTFIGASHMPYQELLLQGREQALAFQRLAGTEAFKALGTAEQNRLRQAFEQLAPAQAVHPSTLVGNLLNMIAARVAHELDLSGPAWAVDTACSASLVAVHQACASLKSGECELALAGGIHLTLTPTLYRFFWAAGALSSSGRTRAFSALGDGFVPGEGGGLILLKPLDAARDAGDEIIGVIKGSAVNNDGRSIGVMAPNPEGQLVVLREAYRRAGIEPGSVSAVECHGTGTRLGDPLELRALVEFYGERPDQPLAIGSIKSNLGHLLAGAGIAGLLKLLLALRHRQLPPSIHGEPLHPRLAQSASLKLVQALQPWEGQRPLRAGINSFGFGGTNCHLVIEEPPAPTTMEAVPSEVAGDAPTDVIEPTSHLVVLSAPTRRHLCGYAEALADAVSTAPPELPRLARVLHERRSALAQRAARVVHEGENLSRIFSELGSGESGRWVCSEHPCQPFAPLRVAWLFGGQGSQFPGQALGLVQRWPAFRRRLVELCRLVQLERPLLDFCYGEAASEEALRRTDVAQPLLVAFQIALAQSLMDLGHRPSAVLGHSIGEFAAACVAGALSAQEAVTWTARRGRLMQELPGTGGMLAVLASQDRVRPVIAPFSDVVVAADNGPAQTVISGSDASLSVVRARLEEQGLRLLPVPVSHAFHSPLMAAMADGFAQELRSPEARPLDMPLFSTVTGAAVDASDLGPSHWTKQVVQPVLFAQAFQGLQAHSVHAFLEIGPGSTLTGLIRHLLDGDDRRLAVSLCRAPGDVEPWEDWNHALSTLGRLWVRGARLPGSLSRATGLPVSSSSLPTIPFIEESLRIPDVWTGVAGISSLLFERVWEDAPIPGATTEIPAGTWLLLADDTALCRALASRLSGRRARSYFIEPGETFTRVEEDRFTVRPDVPDHYRWLQRMLGAEPLAGIVSLLGLRHRTDQGEARDARWLVDELAAFARGWEARQKTPIWWVTGPGHTTGHPTSAIEPAQAALAAAVQALLEERPDLQGHVIDLDTAADTAEALGGRLFDEICHADSPFVALRAGGRWIPRLRPYSAAVTKPIEEPTTPRGVYLLTGGTGGTMLVLGRELLSRRASLESTRLVITGRRHEREVSKELAELRGPGREVVYRRVDVTDHQEMSALVDELVAAHGRIDGVIHGAGALVMGSLSRCTPDEVASILDPKLGGALLLSQVLADVPVGFVALMSSVAGSVAGLGGGMAAYAAANAGLDSLAVRERIRGKPWVSIAWSLWRDTGLGRKIAAQLADERGLAALDPAEACEAFFEVLRTDLAQVIVAQPSTIEAASIRTRSRDATPRPEPDLERQVSGIRPRESSIRPQEEPDLALQTAGSVPREEEGRGDPGRAGSVKAEVLTARVELEEYIRRQLALATDSSPEAIDLDAPFQRLGLGSLAAVDLLKDLEAQVGMELSTTLLFEYNSIRKVLDHIEHLASYQAPAQPEARDADVARTAFPILPAQQTFYANQSFYPDMPCYVFLRLDLEGPVVLEHLDHAMSLLFARHPMLSMVFEWRDGQVVQLRGQFAPPPVEVHDLRGQSASLQHEVIDGLDEAIRNQVFDLAHGPMLRVVLCRLTEQRSCLMFNVHHIVADAWSAQILVTELLELHAQLLAMEPPHLPVIRSTFEDFARLLERPENRQSSAESRRYWAEVLLDQPVLNLPVDGDPEAEASGPCRILQCALDESTTARLGQRARDWEVSAFHLVFAGYLCALHRWSGESDLVVRVANARREARLPDIERVVGSFADSLPVRVQVPDGLGIPELCRRVAQATIQAQRHPLTSSMEVAGLWGRRRHLGPRGVTPAGLSFPSFAAPDRYGPVRVLGMRGGAASGFTQLGLIVWEFLGRLHFSWNYHEQLFSTATMERLAREYLELSKRLVNGDLATVPPPVPMPIRSVGTPIGGGSRMPTTPSASFTGTLSPEPGSGHGPDSAPGARGAEPEPYTCPPGPFPGDRVHDLDLWTPLPLGTLVHQRIFARIDSCPERPAVQLAERSLTYRELGDRARAVASALRQAGAGPGKRVGILAYPSLDATVGVLGILASGAAYVPLDPDYPDARLTQIAGHSAIEHLVTCSEHAGRVAAIAPPCLRTLLLLDQDEAGQPRCPAPPSTSLRDLPSSAGRSFEILPWSGASSGQPSKAPSEQVTADDLAYVMYTSGTTGHPKGVMVTHRAVSLFHDWVHEAFRVTAADRFIQTSSLGFGGSIRQIFSPLLAGATLIPTPRDLLRDPDGLARFLDDNAITIWNSVPTLWMRLLEHFESLDTASISSSLTHLRWILLGGEDVPVDLVRRWMDRFGKRHRIANLYGSTETVVNATAHLLSEPLPRDATHLPIGRARPGSEVYLLDARGEPCRQPMEVGEIHVGGPSLATGYLNEPALTEAAFVQVPGITGRVYRTGDLARLDEGGDLVFLGRMDTQVKIRGNRVELGEIESVLGLHPQVRSAAVLEYRDDERQWLVAFVEPRSGDAPPEAAELRNHVAARLPGFMVPHRFELLRPMPLTAAGKIDREALRDLVKPLADEASDDTPRTGTELLLARVWRELLGLKKIGIHSDFFELGGDSILALSMFQRLRGALPVLPRPITLYGERTIARLGRLIDELNARERAGSATVQGADAPRAAATITRPVESSPSGPAAAQAPPATPPDASSLPSAATAADGYPLAPSQEAFILAQRLRPEQVPVWCAAIPVRGRLDIDTLRLALEAAVRRHPQLRTVFRTVHYRTLQYEVEPGPLPLLLEDLSDLSGEALERALEERFEAERTTPFELDTWPLWRMRLCRLGPDRWTWLITVHHAIGDGWSLCRLGSQVLQDYDARSRGDQREIHPPATTFREVVAYLAQRASQYTGPARRYWADRFAAPWPEAHVEPMSSRTADVGTLVTGELSAEQTRTLRQIARRAGGLFNLLATLWYRVLVRLTGVGDLVIGTAISGRDLDLPEVGDIFGCFTTGLPLRLDLADRELDAQTLAISNVLVEACQNADLSAADLFRQIPRHPGSPYPPGSAHFFSYMDFQALPEVVSQTLDVDWEAGRYHFAAQTTETELMLGVMAGKRLHLNLHGLASRAARKRALDEMLGEIDQVIRGGSKEEQGRGPALSPAVDVVTPIDAAIIGYLPAPAHLRRLLCGLPPDEPLRRLVRSHLFADGRPRLLDAIHTPMGVSGSIILPRFADELEQTPGQELVAELVEAFDLARERGARCVSLAGLLPACTDYGLAVLERIREQDRAASRSTAPTLLTTGHATTVVAMVLTVAELLERLHRPLGTLDLAVVGFGSIGQASLELLREVLGTPRSVQICDRPQRRPHLEKPVRALEARFGLPVAIATEPAEVARVVRRCQLVLGASSQGDVLRVSDLSPGTLIVDDSLPSLCDEVEAHERMSRQKDVLICAGGRLDLEITRRLFSGALDVPGISPDSLSALDAPGIPGCRVEPLLLVSDPGLTPVHGLVRPEIAIRYWQAVKRWNLLPAPLHLGTTRLPEELLERSGGRVS